MEQNTVKECEMENNEHVESRLYKQSVVVPVENIPTTPSISQETSKLACSIDKPFPLIGFLKRYKKDYFQYDLVCGITTGIIAIPQGMANALMANLPPVYGLYGAIMPVFLHSLFTTSSQLHVGPYAVASIMCASTLSFLDFESQREEYIGTILMIAVISGVFLSFLSFLRLGVITRILSNAVVTGFTAASSIQIISSQLGGFWDVRSGSGSSVRQLLQLFSPSVISQFNWYAFLIGVVSSVLLYTGKQLNKKYCPTTPIPLELGIVILFILLTYFCNLKEKWHIKIIGDYDVVKGFPPFSIPILTHTLRILPGSLMISIICFSTQVSLGKSFAQQFQYRLDANQELLALGMSQLGGAFFSSLPGSASISRSSVVASIGGKSPVFSLLSPLVVLVCLFFFMDWIAYLPNSVLVTVVIVNLIGMLKRFTQLKRFYQCCKPDFWSFVVCTIVLIFFGAEYGLIAGILTSLGLLFLTIRTLPPEKKVSDLSPDNSGRKVIAAGQTFHFLNCDYVVREVEKEVQTKSTIPLWIDLRRVMYIDTSGLNAIVEITKILKSYNRTFTLLVQGTSLGEKLELFGIKDIKLAENENQSI